MCDSLPVFTDPLLISKSENAFQPVIDTKCDQHIATTVLALICDGRPQRKGSKPAPWTKSYESFVQAKGVLAVCLSESCWRPLIQILDDSNVSKRPIALPL